MAETLCDLLDDPLITVRLAGGEHTQLALPEILERLGGGDSIDDFPALRPHQAQAWYTFLVQVAAMAAHRVDKVPRAAASDWRAWLEALGGKERSAWCLVVPDLSLPALLQPPVPEGNLKAFKRTATRPDEIDMLVTAKNHDLKGARMVRAGPEHWLFALLTLQTMEGYSGSRNYGIARMNSGLGNRPLVALAPGLEWSDRFRRDTEVLIEHREATARDHGFASADGLGLTWLEPWSGGESFPISELDPWHIEVCRRLRLGWADEGIVAHVANSKVARTEAKERNGDLGDPWTPVDREQCKALTISRWGFGYALTQELLLGGQYRASPSQQVRSDDRQELLFWATGLVRGQGKTEGLHQRLLPIPARVRAILGQTDERAQLAGVAKRRVAIVDVVQSKVLRPALGALLAGASEGISRWTRALTRAVDAIFFERLWRDGMHPDGDREWAREVIELARCQLDGAIESSPIPAARFYQLVAKAKQIFEGSARRQFPDVFAQPVSAQEEGAVSDEQHIE